MRRDFTACILKPRGPFHVGVREGMREGSETFVHSDTLFSAFCHSLLLLYGREKLEQFLAAENNADPPLVLSSAFPYWKGRYYFPVPRNQLAENKEQKRIQFVAQAEFERLLNGGKLNDGSLAAGIPGKNGTPWATDDVPKVTVSRTGGSATDEGGFYHVGLVHYDKDADLFFLVDFRSAEWEPKLRAAIRLMCDEGIGGYRSIGKGRFEQPRFTTVTLETPADADATIMLSLYYPAGAEATSLADGWFDLIPRKGYVFSPDTRSLRRKELLMFAEGSVLPGDSRKGLLVDVTPDNANQLGLGHRVFRNGLAFCVPCKGGGHG